MFWQSNLFTVHSWETKALSITLCNLDILSIGKDTFRKALFRLDGKATIKYYEPLTNACAARLQGIDSWIHVTQLKKTLDFDWNCTPFGDLKVKMSQN